MIGHAKAPSAGSTEGKGSSRGLSRRAFAIRGARNGSSGSGARFGGRSKGLLTIFALVVCVLGITAAPALARDPQVSSVVEVSEVKGGSVHVAGEVDAAGEATYRFETSTDGVNWAGTDQPTIFNEVFVPVSTTITGLKGSTKYFVRLVAYNCCSTIVSSEPYAEFETLPVAKPAVLAIEDASAVFSTTAKLAGEIERPVGGEAALDVECNFEYVTDATFDENEANSLPGFEGASQIPCKPPLLKTPGPAAVSASPTELEPATTYHLRLSATNAGGTVSKVAANTFTTTPMPVVDPPSVLSADAATEVTATTAKVTGSVERSVGADPLFDLNCKFEYITTAQFSDNESQSLPGFEGATQVPCEPDPVTTPGPNPVQATLTGLTTGTTYHLRLTVSNFGGNDSLEANNFKTTSVIVAQTLGVGKLQITSATLSGQINPDNAQAVDYQFEWGVEESEGDETYEEVAPSSAEPLGAIDKASHVVSAAVDGLQSAATYHYRVVATDTQTGSKTFGQDRTFTTPSAPVLATCPNETSRVGLSAALPDCRAYEWVSPGLNSANVVAFFHARIWPDGGAVLFQTVDAIDDAPAHEALFNLNIARRQAGAWSTKSLLPPLTVASSSFGWVSRLAVVSNDLSQSVVISNQPLAGADSPTDGFVFYYLRRADGTYVPLITKGNTPNQGECCRVSEDFKHIFFSPSRKQLSMDPTNGYNAYEWFEGQLRLIGVLPDAEGAAPEGADLAGSVAFPPFSDDGERVLFKAKGRAPLYMRSGGTETVEVSATQRTVDQDPNPTAPVRSQGISKDGSKVFFISGSELTNDANTGETDGVANDSGHDLYSYDVESGDLTDLTVASSPADKEHGADVKLVVGASDDASYIYFVAKGNLAPGARSGEPNLYVWHNGAIDFIAPGDGLIGAEESSEIHVSAPFLATPDGRHAIFNSSLSLTGYDNTNPENENLESEVFKYTYKGTLECVSCRPDGGAPIGSSTFSSEEAGVPADNAISDDGSRVFFSSTDALLPGVWVGFRGTYEYENGQLKLISPPGSESAVFLLGASPSGDDVFLATHEELSSSGPGFLPNGPGKASAIYDARVNADLAKPFTPVCQGENCHGAGTSPPNSPSPGSANFEALGKLSAPGSNAVRGANARLRLTVPGSGELTISGKGLKPVEVKATKAGPVTVTLTLKPAANKTRKKKGIYKAKAEILFKSSTGDISRADVALKFEATAKKKGGK